MSNTKPNSLAKYEKFCCKTCFWWVELTRMQALAKGVSPGQTGKLGECHGDTPKIFAPAPGQVIVDFPVTPENLFCGRHEDDPEKIIKLEEPVSTITDYPATASFMGDSLPVLGSATPIKKNTND